MLKASILTNANHYIARKFVYDNEQSCFLLSLIKWNRCYFLFGYLNKILKKYMKS
jgi:hypothetical protein